MTTEQIDFEPGTIDSRVLERSVARFREAGIPLPRFAELADYPVTEASS